MSWRALTVLPAAAVLAGCATTSEPTRALFTNASVNQKPATIMMDSGANMTWFRDDWADRDGFRATVLPQYRINEHGSMATTDALGIALGEQQFTSALTIYRSDSEPLLVRSVELLSRVSGDPWGFDGAIGWPDVRRNILVLDGSTRTIRATPTLPAETADWVKLAIRRDLDSLHVEVPMPDGRTLVLFIDTGAPGGISLPPELWDEWRRANPRAEIGRGFGMVPGSKVRVGQYSFAESYALGPLKLTDVSIDSAGPAENGELRAGMGLNALRRMKLVLDDAQGFAYFQAFGPVELDAAVPAGKRAAAVEKTMRPTWTIDPSVKVDTDALRSRSLVNEGWLLESGGEHVAAVAKYAEAAALTPGSPAGYSAIAGLYRRDHHPDIALREIARVIAGKPEQAAARNALGLVRIDLGDYDGAIGEFNRALELDPAFGAAYNNRAAARLRKGELAGALRDLETLVSLQPWNAEAFFAHSDVALQNGDLDRSIRDLDGALRLQPENAEFLAQRSRLRLRLGDYDGASADADQAIALEADEKLGHVARASVATIRGDFKVALAENERVIALSPTTSSYQQIYRELLRRRLKQKPAGEKFSLMLSTKSDDWVRAIARFVAGAGTAEELLAAADRGDAPGKEERSCEAWYFIGLIRLGQGNGGSARQAFESAVALNSRQSAASQFARAELGRLKDPM